jgi:hypothetical protein
VTSRAFALAFVTETGFLQTECRSRIGIELAKNKSGIEVDCGF